MESNFNLGMDEDGIEELKKRQEKGKLRRKEEPPREFTRKGLVEAFL